MKIESKALVLFRHFARTIQTLFDKQVKKVRLNNTAKKFLSKGFQEFLSKQGILHQMASTYALKQNSAVERKHKYPLEEGIEVNAFQQRHIL